MLFTHILPNLAEEVEKAISMSDLGMTPNNDGQMIRLNVPPREYASVGNT